ncbi:MAG: S41 family peptidase [Bacteroidota bacterium]
MIKLISTCLLAVFPLFSIAQDYGDFPRVSQDKLLRDLEILYQGLDQFHSGMYWYTPKDSVDQAFAEARQRIDRDMSVLEFYKIMAPLVGLSREDHTDMYLPDAVAEQVNEEGTFLPLVTVFLGKKLYCIQNASDQEGDLEGKEIEQINGQSPQEFVAELGSMFASDGYIKPVKYSDLSGFSFAEYLYYYYGKLDSFRVTIGGEELTIAPLTIEEIIENLSKRYPDDEEEEEASETLEFKILRDSIAYLGIHTFNNDRISENAVNHNLKKFLDQSFATLQERGISTLMVDVSQNGGGNEGNENLLFSYLGDNYQKYHKVRAKTQRAVLNNGVDEPISLKTFGWLERTFANRLMPDGSYERRSDLGIGLMAYRKEPSYKFRGKVYVIISPVTYSGGSEFANMMATRGRATFVGQETGGGYYGNTSGYSAELTLPHSGIMVDLPALQFVMNVEEKYPFGSGVIPDHPVVPTIEQYLEGGNASLDYILEVLEK